MSSPIPPPPPSSSAPPPPPSPDVPPTWQAAPGSVRPSPGLATAAMVCGIVGVIVFFFFVPSVVALVLGLVAAQRAKRSGAAHGGLGRARAGWILGLVGVVAFGAFVVAAIATDGFGEGEVSVYDLDVGDCVDVPDGAAASEVRSLDSFDCSIPHDAEVFAVDDLAIESDDYPGEDEVIVAVEDACSGARFEDYVGTALAESDLTVYYLYPIEREWERRDDREYVCLAVALDGTSLSGSVEGSGR